MEFTSISHDGYEFSFPRITVILGANGCGKSTLLRNIRDSTSCVYVEGGRTITIADTVVLDSKNFNRYQLFESTLQHHKSKRKQTLVSRIFDALMVLIQQGQQLKDNHSDAVTKWDQDGRIGELPKRLQPPLEKLFEHFNEMFPNLTLSYNNRGGRLHVTNSSTNTSYGPSKLSDGEKQVFSLLCDMLQIDDELTTIIVDEPELNLHPELAERLWTLLESEYQNKSFIYASHSIQFAMRHNVDALYIMSSDASKISKLESISEMQRTELEKFLGGVPGLLNSSKVIVTEGHEKSFDAIFYRWLLGDNKIEIFPCGNCNDVTQVIRKTGLWSQISSDITLIGVIDSDFKTESKTQTTDQAGIKILPLHEAESYICLPEVVEAAAHAIGSMEKLLTATEAKSLIFDQLKSSRLPIALRLCFSESEHVTRLSLERRELTEIRSKSDAMALIENKSVLEITKAVAAMSPKTFEEKLDKHLEIIDRAISEQNVLEALRFLPGKQLADELARRAGCKNVADLARSAKRNLQVDNFPILAALRDDLLKLTGLVDAPVKISA